MDELLFKFFGMYALFLTIIGTIGNIIIFIVTSKLTKPNTFVYLRFLAISDILTLYYWNLDKFVLSFTRANYQNMSVAMCKIGNYIQYTTLQFSSWMLVNKFIIAILSFYGKLISQNKINQLY